MFFGGMAAFAAEGEWRWRLFEIDDKAVLAFTDSDYLTDSTSTSFSCAPRSGRIDLVGTMDKRLREAIAEAIRTDSSPRGDLLPEEANAGLLFQPSYSELDGWMYSFDFSASAAGFERFARTGVFQFKIGSTSVAWKELKEGLENVAKFRELCSREAARPGQGTK